MRHKAILLAAAASAVALTSCSSSGSEGLGTAPTTTAGSSSASSSAPASTFPITMEHAFGSTTIESEPQRVVTYGWGVTDAALAVGVVPVAMEFQQYGADDKGVLPWIADEVDDLGVDLPTVLPKATKAPPYEAILNAQPDLILATGSGITEKQYDLLSEIAPTVAYTGKPYTTPWQDMFTQTATALGKAAEGKAVLADINDELSDEAADHPELAGKTMAAVWDVGGTFYVYKKADARVDFMLDLGPTSAPSVDDLANGDETFYYTLSYEQVGKLDSDILVAYNDTQQGMDEFLSKSYAKAMSAVQSGAVAEVVGTEKIAAVSPPTALSLPWGLDSLVDQLSKAAKAADAAS